METQLACSLSSVFVAFHAVFNVMPVRFITFSVLSDVYHVHYRRFLSQISLATMLSSSHDSIGCLEWSPRTWSPEMIKSLRTNIGLVVVACIDFERRS